MRLDDTTLPSAANPVAAAFQRFAAVWVQA